MTSDILDKIRRLTAKAEATPYEAEAMAFAAKAQALMTQHAIDAAMLDVGDAARVATTEIELGDPYASARFSLLGAIARANRCRAVWDKRAGLVTLVGTDVDRANIELLYTSLLLQATTVMTAEGSKVDAFGRNRTRSFRQAFLIGYADEVGRRLHKADREIVEQQSDPGVHPVLASVDAEVDTEMRRLFPYLGAHRPSISSGAGLDAGLAAGRTADIGAPTVRGPSRALPG